MSGDALAYEDHDHTGQHTLGPDTDAVGFLAEERHVRLWPGMTPEELVRQYLGAMERRDLDAARRCLAPGFCMIFPGGKRLDSLEALVEFARGRYRSARKTYERFDTAGDVVYCFGTLSGELLDGSPYDAIRFIDRFTVRGGKLVDQQVWNDMAEMISTLGGTHEPQ